jgi:uncharacterized protein GlcG (DUF336 family)
MGPPERSVVHLRPEVDLSGGEALDNHHAAGAFRAAVSACRLRFADSSGIQQRTAAGKCRTAAAVGKETKVADADQASGQDMEQEAAQELMRRDGHDLLLVAMRVVSPTEGDAAIAQGDKAMIGDGDAVGISGQVAQNLFRPAERRLGIDHPIAGE